MTIENSTGPACATDGVGFKHPPKAMRWTKGQSGNPAGKPLAVNLKQLVQKANAKTVVIKTSEGKLKKMRQGELVLEKTFHEAIGGDVRAQKILMKYAKEYLPESDSTSDGHLAYFDITSADVVSWKAFGCLPAECSDIPEEISLTMLNKAQRTFKKIWDELSSTPAGLEQRNLILDKIYGPLSDYMDDDA